MTGGGEAHQPGMKDDVGNPLRIQMNGTDLSADRKNNAHFQELVEKRRNVGHHPPIMVLQFISASYLPIAFAPGLAGHPLNWSPARHAVFQIALG